MTTRLNLDRLLRPHNFPTDPSDFIKRVKITSLRLKPFNGECDITIKIPDNSNHTIYDLAAKWVNFENSEIINILTVREVEMIINFHEESRIVKVKVHANGDYSLSNLSTSHYQLVEKYLKYWQLIE